MTPTEIVVEVDADKDYTVRRRVPKITLISHNSQHNKNGNCGGSGRVFVCGVYLLKGDLYQ